MTQLKVLCRPVSAAQLSPYTHLFVGDVVNVLEKNQQKSLIVALK